MGHTQKRLSFLSIPSKNSYFYAIRVVEILKILSRFFTKSWKSLGCGIIWAEFFGDDMSNISGDDARLNFHKSTGDVGCVIAENRFFSITFYRSVGPSSFFSKVRFT